MHSKPGEDILARRAAFLKTVPLFAQLTEADLLALLNDFRLREYGRDEIIFRQGDSSRRLYVVAEGKIRIFKISPSGNETSISILTTHDIIGEFAAVDSQPRSATAKAISRCILLEIASDSFLEHMRRIPDLALGMTRLLASKVRWSAIYAETIAQYNAAGRLLHILLHYNEQLGERQEPGQRYVLDLSLNQSDLATLIGARREHVNRLLRSWQKRGLIEYDAGKIIILDLPRVEAERDSQIEANQANWDLGDA